MSQCSDVVVTFAIPGRSLKEPAQSHVWDQHPLSRHGIVDDAGVFHFWSTFSPDFQFSTPLTEPREQPAHETCETPMNVDDDEVPHLPMLEEDESSVIVISSSSSSSSYSSSSMQFSSSSSSSSPPRSFAGSGYYWRESASSLDLHRSDFDTPSSAYTSTSCSATIESSCSEKTEGSASSSND